GSITPLADTWVLELSPPAHWTRLTSANAPPARYGCAAVFDRSRDRVLLFGGSNNAGFYSDVYAHSFTGTPNWVRLAGNAAPTGGRVFAGAALDSVGDKMLIMGGGLLGVGFTSADDTWMLSLADGTTWTPIFTSNSPGPRYGHTAVFDPARRE